MLKNRCCPWFDRLTIRAKPLKTRGLILSLSKDEAKISCFFGVLLATLLAVSGVSAQACQLSLLGPVTQRPLTYNPFQAGASTAEVTFTLRNADSQPCDAAFAFFRLGAPQAQADGATLNYQVLGQSGPVTQGLAAAPGALPGAGAAANSTVGARQTHTAHAIVSVGDGQVAGPGLYTDRLTLGLYQRAAGTTYTKVADAPLTVTINVNSQMTLAVAGGGRKTTLNFGDFVDGAIRSVNLLVFSNQGFRLVVRSDNGGVMKPIDRVALAEGQWRVPYMIAVNRSGPVDLSRARAISLGQGATAKSGLVIPVDVQIGSTKGQRAGIYRDVITVAINPGP
jgi:hypothetical protein